MIGHKTSRAAVMTGPRQDLEIQDYPILPAPADGAIVRVNLCTICRSDLHTWLGQRPAKTPLILGHEIVGTVVESGRNLTRDGSGRTLTVGDRVTWTLHNSCGNCRYCRDYQLPMKCEHLRKYGHEPCDQPPYLQGGFAEYCVIDAGTTLVRIPDNLDNIVAAPANCAVATVIAGWEAANLSPGDSVLIQGAGALGCYAAAFARYVGCRHIVVSDISAERLEFARRFGATECIDSAHTTNEEFVARVKKSTASYGADCALELAGVPDIIEPGLASLRKGGRYVEIGCVFPYAYVNIDMSLVLQNMLTIRGVHNYDARHLVEAIRFLVETQNNFPYHEIVGSEYQLEEINDALHAALSGWPLRVALRF